MTDATGTDLGQRGKQVLKPSSIWQTVWLEVVPALSISSLRLTPGLNAETMTVEMDLRGAPSETPIQIEAEASFAGQVVSTGSGNADKPLVLKVADPRTWSPAHPELYDLKVKLTRAGQTVDEVGSYFGMRKFEVKPDAVGQPRFMLNGEPLFLTETPDVEIEINGYLTYDREVEKMDAGFLRDLHEKLISELKTHQ